MELTLQHNPSLLIFHACIFVPEKNHYRLKIADAWHEKSLILTPTALSFWEVNDVSMLRIEHFQQLANLEVEIVILGTGTSSVFPASKITHPLMKKRIGLEVMEIAAACRTYNLLVSDGRVAVAALIQ